MHEIKQLYKTTVHWLNLYVGVGRSLVCRGLLAAAAARTTAPVVGGGGRGRVGLHQPDGRLGRHQEHPAWRVRVLLEPPAADLDVPDDALGGAVHLGRELDLGLGLVDRVEDGRHVDRHRPLPTFWRLDLEDLALPPDLAAESGERDLVADLGGPVTLIDAASPVSGVAVEGATSCTARTRSPC